VKFQTLLQFGKGLKNVGAVCTKRGTKFHFFEPHTLFFQPSLTALFRAFSSQQDDTGGGQRAHQPSKFV
jgi:hypothetical protein